ncbi:MAG: cupin domain-containing protein, partial [Planctomycetota bacterium]
MAEKEDKAHILAECLGKGQKMIELIEYSNDSIVSKTLLDKSVGTITLFAFDKGQKLSEHTA